MGSPGKLATFLTSVVKYCRGVGREKTRGKGGAKETAGLGFGDRGGEGKDKEEKRLRKC